MGEKVVLLFILLFILLLLLLLHFAAHFLQRGQASALRICFSGKLGSARLMAELDDLKGLFHTECFYDSSCVLYYIIPSKTLYLNPEGFFCFIFPPICREKMRHVSAGYDNPGQMIIDLIDTFYHID